jgi:NitT/TauT family transport system permease protein
MRVRRYQFRPRLLYQTSLAHNLVSIALAALVAFLSAVALLHVAHPKNAFDISRVSIPIVLEAAANTFYRMFLGYLAAVVVAIPLALFISSTPKIQRITLPVADVLQSVPVLAFFPVVVASLAAYGAFEAAAIFIIFIQMVWNIVFPVIGGLLTIPDDIKSAAIVFNVRGWRRFWYITLPAIFPFVVTGSLLAWAQGWTVVIVAEVLHAYIPHGRISQDLLGLGSLLVDSNAQGRSAVFAITLTTMILLIALLNLVVWQPLLHFAQRFRFD